MSDTYIGPFGRILPISGRPTDPSPLDKHSRMIVSTAPRLPLPTKLNFGSDPMSGFTDPGRYESGSSARRTLPGTRPGSHEKLPSVSQLLTPGSTGPTGSPFSLGVTGSGSPVSPGHHSSHVSSYTESHQRSDSGHFQGAYGSLPVSQSRYASIPAPSSSPYGHPYQDTSRSYMSTDAQRPAQSVHSPSQGPYYAPPPQSHSYGQNKMPPMVAGQPHSDPANPTKPVMKVVGEQNIHGEGICYLYEDGSHVKKYIDGEAVNAQWGVTKAGKPRKRLAIACMTCREKKIKCDPGEPKCVQCDKSGRECRFQTAVRSQMNKKSSLSYEQQARAPSSLSDRIDLDSEDARSSRSETSRLPGGRSHRSSSIGSITRRKLGNLHEAAQALHITKKRRRGSKEVTPLDEYTDQNQATNSIGLGWTIDPYQAQPHITLHYLHMFFAHLNGAVQRIFPRKAFMDWIRDSKVKSPDELMVLYSILAASTNYSTRPSKDEEGKLFFEIVEQAVEESKNDPGVMLVQTHLFLGFYLLAGVDPGNGWEECATAGRMAMKLKMNSEQHITALDNQDLSRFGLGPSTFVECKRRTFWGAYLMDIYKLFGRDPGVAFMQKEDIKLRLPCDDDLYEEDQAETRTPFFDNGYIDKRLTRLDERSTAPGMMAYLVQLTAILGDIFRQAYRTREQASEDYPLTYESFYDEKIKQLLDWRSSHPEFFHFNAETIAISLERGTLGLYTSLFSVYYITVMTLCRRVKQSLLSDNAKSRNLRVATENAQELMNFMQMVLDVCLEAERRFTPPPSPEPMPTSALPVEYTHPFRSNTFSSYVTLYALDILTKAVRVDHASLSVKHNDIEFVLSVTERLSKCYPAIGALRKNATYRRELLLQGPAQVREATEAFMFDQAIWPVDTDSYDLFYGPETAIGVLKAMEIQGAENVVFLS